MLLSTLREGLTARLREIPNMTVDARPTSAPPVPYAWFLPPEASFNATMGRGSDDFNYTIVVAVSAGDIEESIREVEQYMSGHGEHSVRAALETSTGVGDPLDGEAMVAVDSAEVGRMSFAEGGGFTTVTFQVRTTVDGTT